jgi:hypothetical protein
MLVLYQSVSISGSISNIDTPVSGLPSLFSIDSVHQIVSSLSRFVGLILSLWSQDMIVKAPDI